MTNSNTSQCKDCGKKNPADIHTCTPSEDWREEFGEMAKRLRLRARYGLREFCRDMKIDPSRWSKVERGVLHPSTQLFLGFLKHIPDITEEEQRRLELLFKLGRGELGPSFIESLLKKEREKAIEEVDKELEKEFMKKSANRGEDIIKDSVSAGWFQAIGHLRTKFLTPDEDE